jgi:hypothetical protein
MHECTAYIPNMSCEDSKRARNHQRQALYEAGLRDSMRSANVKFVTQECETRPYPETSH